MLTSTLRPGPTLPASSYPWAQGVGGGSVYRLYPAAGYNPKWLGLQVCATEAVAVEEDIATPRRDSALTAWVNVIYGCNEKCTYCVVPFTRYAPGTHACTYSMRRMYCMCSTHCRGPAVLAALPCVRGLCGSMPWGPHHTTVPLQIVWR